MDDVVVHDIIVRGTSSLWFHYLTFQSYSSVDSSCVQHLLYRPPLSYASFLRLFFLTLPNSTLTVDNPIFLNNKAETSHVSLDMTCVRKSDK